MVDEWKFFIGGGILVACLFVSILNWHNYNLRKRNRYLKTKLDFRTERLRQNEQAFSDLVHGMGGMYYHASPDDPWFLTFVSEGSSNLIGYPSETLYDRPYFGLVNLLYLDDRDKAIPQIASALREQHPFNYKCRIFDYAGDTKWVWHYGYGRYDVEGNLHSVVGFFVPQIPDSEISTVP